MRRLVLVLAIAAISSSALIGAAWAAAAGLDGARTATGKERGSAEGVYESGLGEGVVELESLGGQGAGGGKVHRGSGIAESRSELRAARKREREAAARKKAKKRKAAEEKAAEEAEAEAAEEEESGALSSLAIGDGASTLEELEVPTALLSVYQACGTRYGISWEVLAAINKVETGFGTDLGTSGAGAEGWMQFLPSSWKEWGIDADGNGKAETDDPVDAICSAARYLAASGGESDIYEAVYAYNHADWYVKEVLADARRYERVAANLVDSLTELSEGGTFPVGGRSSFYVAGAAAEALEGSGEWAGEAVISSGEDESAAGEAAEGEEAGEGEEAEAEGASATKTATIDAEAGAKVLAVTDGTVTKAGADEALGRYVVLKDAFGDRFVYSGLGKVTVGAGDEVAEGDVLGSAGEAAIGFSIRPDASTAVDPTELLELWKQGGVGKVYGVDAEGDSPATKAVRSPLMSAAALKREALADEDLELPACVRKAIEGDHLRRQGLAALEYLTGRGYKLGVDASTCKHESGFTVEIASVDGKSVEGEGAQGEGTAARELAKTVTGMDASTAPQTVASATGIAAAETGGTSAKAIELDYQPPQKATIVNGDAVAPTDAPAAVQAMIAAANQIDETPYVWGGGHGAWVSSGYDCSGSVSYVLHAAKLLSTPEVSGALASFGESGTGNWVTIYANAEHVYAEIAGLRWDTVGDATGSGPRWHTGAPYPAGFAVRHPAGL